MRRVSLFHFSLVNTLFSRGLLLTDTLQVKESGLETPPTKLRQQLTDTLQVKESGLETPPTEANSELTSTLPTFAQ